MKTRNTFLDFSMLFLAFCSIKSSAQNTVRVRVDTEFVKQMFPAQKDVLTGGDGCISIDMGKGKSVYFWGDSFLGEVVDNKRDKNTPLIFGNVFTTLENGVSKTYHGGTKEAPTSVIVSPPIDGNKTMLWPEHGFVKNNILHQMYSEIVTFGTGTWDFRWNSTVYCRLSLPDFKEIDRQTIPAKDFGDVHYGFAFLPIDDYMYFYGSKVLNNVAGMYVARGKMNADKLGDYEFFDGKNFQQDASKAIALEGMDVNLSEQFSVFEYKGIYILITQERGIGTNDIYSFVSDSPTGKWRNKKKIYTTPEPIENKAVFSYNAMAHPQYIKNGEILISYCVNGHNPEDLFADASIYRPRFIWANLKDILN